MKGMEGWAGDGSKSAQVLFRRRNLWRGSPADAGAHCHRLEIVIGG
jgi:hypothetical protein